MDFRSKPAIVVACLAAFAILACTVASYVADEARPGHAGPLTDPTDFVAFYCGGKVVAAGKDPYLAEPLRACEDAAFAESHIAMMQHLVVPAPLPPYALAGFAPFSLLSFRDACVAFFLLAIAATGTAIGLSYRLAKISLPLVGVATMIALGIGSIFIGQLVPIVVMALCGSALALRSGRIGIATGFAMLAMIEPNVGLAAVLGILILEPRSRTHVTLGALLVLLTSLAYGGFERNIEYFTAVLPAHALSEVANFHAQYSLTALVYALGASARVAMQLGEASYLAMLVGGLWLAYRLKRSTGDAAFAILAPTACVVIGGVFVHDHQMAVALPFAFLLARYERRRALVVATLVLAVPWQSVFEMFFTSLFPPHLRFDPGPALALVANGSYLAETSWHVWIDLLGGRDGRTPFEMFLFKLPTWFALATLLWFALKARFQPALGTRLVLAYKANELQRS